MKQIFYLAVIVTVQMLNIAESNPSTLCLYTKCGAFFCNEIATLEIRNRYKGEVSSDQADYANEANFNNGKCSTDGVFCVKTFPNSNDLVLTYGNVAKNIPGSSQHLSINLPNSSCEQSDSFEYWMDL